MKSSEARLGEAIASLTTALDHEGIEDAGRKAHDFMTELLRQGWRAVAHEVPQHTPGGDRHAHPNTVARECQVAREEIAMAKAKLAAKQLEDHA